MPNSKGKQRLPAAYDVTDKAIFITGAGRGIGKGTAAGLAAAGADVMVLDGSLSLA